MNPVDNVNKKLMDNTLLSLQNGKCARKVFKKGEVYHGNGFNIAVCPNSSLYNSDCPVNIYTAYVGFKASEQMIIVAQSTNQVAIDSFMQRFYPEGWMNDENIQYKIKWHDEYPVHPSFKTMKPMVYQEPEITPEIKEWHDDGILYMDDPYGFLKTTY